MKIRTVLLAVVATSALSTGAFAAVGSLHDMGHPSSREQMTASCTILENQYNKIVEGKLDSAVADKAAGLHAQGVNDCESNNTDLGVLKLKQAVRILGEKPAA